MLAAPSTGILKPFLWPVDPLQVAPEWWDLWSHAFLAAPFWEGGGSPQDYSPAQLGGATLSGAEWGVGTRGRAIVRDAAADDVYWPNNPDHALDADVPFFVFVSVDLASVAVNQFAAFLSRRSTFADGYWALAQEDPTENLAFYLRSGGSLYSILSSTVIGAGYQTVAAVRRTGGVWTLYHNGLPVHTETQTNLPGSGSHVLNVGKLQQGGTSEDYEGDFFVAYGTKGWAPTDQQVAALARDPFGPFRPARRVVVTVPAGGATTVTVGLATETDTAFGVGAAKNQSVGLASETDSGLGVTAQKTVTVGLSLETDTSFGVTAAKNQSVGLASESDTAFSVATAKVLDVGLATEADSALAVAIEKVVTAGLASETDTAFAVSTGNAISVGLATEADSAFGVSVAKQLSVGLASETDAALVVVPAKSYPAGLASETDSAFTVDLDRAYAIGLATESDSALAVSIAKALSVGLATETDTALAVIVVGAELDLRPPYTAVWIDRERNALWIDRERVAEWEDRERDAEWEQ